ncbi:MAG: ATP-binding protein, partial [Pseudomonadota bacterium]
ERRITVTLGQTSSDVWLEVADSGHGLGDRSLEELREPFATTRESGKGMGLGLTISAGIISDHGGTISASNGSKTGAVFRVNLPRDLKEAA